MNSREFLEEIRNFSEEYKIWFKPIDRFRKTINNNHIISSIEFKNVARNIDEFTKKQQSENDLPGRIDKFLDNNYSVYLESSPEDCQNIRTSFYGNRDFENFLFGYTRRAVSQLQTSGEEIWLWRGLVSTSLENCGIDYRDTLICLAELFVTAENHGIDAKGSFQKVAWRSSQEKPRGVPTPVAQVLMNFESYAILEERRKMKTGYWDKAL